MGEQDWLTKDFYKVLGVDKGADKKTITKAYRKLARAYHPDQNPGDAAAEAKFKEIGEAYAILSNDEDRKRYDAIRAMGGGGARFAAGSSGGFEDLFGAFNARATGYGGGGARFQTGGADLDDLLSGLFGGGGGAQPHGAQFGAGSFGAPFGAQGRGPQSRPQPVKGGNRKANLTISFRQAVEGAALSIKVAGKTIKVRIPAGIKDGQKIRLAGHGKPGAHGGPAGDLEVSVAVKPHPVFSREGDDVVVTVPVSFAEAALGAKVDVPMLDGSTRSVRIPAGSDADTAIRLKGKGCALKKGPGDLLVRIRIDVPTALTREQKRAVEGLAEALGPVSRESWLEAAKE